MATETQKQDIIEGIARALYVVAYCDFIERASQDGEDVSDLPSASMGEDWMDVTPDTSESAKALARDLAKSIEELNGDDLDELYAQAQTRCEMQEHRCYLGLIHDAHSFGHDLALEALGTGVSWSDRHADHGLRIPRTEFHILDREDLEGEGEGIDTRFC